MQGSADEQLYNEADLDATMAKIEVIDFFQTVNINGILVGGVRRCQEVSGRVGKCEKMWRRVRSARGTRIGYHWGKIHVSLFADHALPRGTCFGRCHVPGELQLSGAVCVSPGARYIPPYPRSR